MKQIQSRGRSAGFALMLPLAVLFSSPAGAADSFSVLAGGAVTCTDSNVIGDVGAGTVLTQTSCTISGSALEGGAAVAQAYADLLSDYDALGDAACDSVLTGTLAGVTLTPGVYCFDAAAALTGTLTLRGSTNGTWLFLVGTSGTGALEATNLSIVTRGADACNVMWWVAQGVELTTSNFVGTILAGEDITVTGGTYTGDVLSGGAGSAELPTGAVTMTGTNLIGCESTSGGGGGHQRCNQGVGNGPEGCDPGNSNQGTPARSNDELGGVPGSPGRKP